MCGLQWPDGKLPDIADELDSSILRDPWFTEPHSFLQTTMHVMLIDLSSGHYPERKPTIHFEGDTLGGFPTETEVWGTMYDEGGDVVRWSMDSIVGAHK